VIRALVALTIENAVVHHFSFTLPIYLSLEINRVIEIHRLLPLNERAIILLLRSVIPLNLAKISLLSIKSIR